MNHEKAWLKLRELEGLWLGEMEGQLGPDHLRPRSVLDREKTRANRPLKMMTLIASR